MSSPEYSSLALTAALSAGDDKRAIEILWLLHRDAIFRYCRRTLGNDVEAADMTQRVFEHAIVSLSCLRSFDAASRWLFGIARHRCLDHARSARRGPRLVDPNALVQVATASHLDGSAEDLHAITRLVACLDRLTASDRTLIDLRYYKGLSFKEIARRLGATPGALRIQLMRACRLLRGYLNTTLMESRKISVDSLVYESRFP